MSSKQIAQMFRLAKDPEKQIYILADLNLCHPLDIVKVLNAESFHITVTPRKRVKA